MGERFRVWSLIAADSLAKYPYCTKSVNPVMEVIALLVAVTTTL